MATGVFTLQTARIYQLTLIACIAAFTQGYDSGVAGGVLTFAPFQRDFHYGTDHQTYVNSLSVSLLQLGAFVCSWFIFGFADWAGRKIAIQASSLIFIVGTILETINSGSLTVWYVGRFVAGFGQGGCSGAVPVFIAEMAPKEIRGKLGSCFQWMYTIGIFTSYWVNYGVSKDISPTESLQWQLPIGLQMVSSSLLFFGIYTLPESARWLLKKGRQDDAWRAFCWVRASPTSGDSPRTIETATEFDNMLRGIEEENAARVGLTWKEIFTRPNRKRFILGASIFLGQQCTGATALAYFSPQFFQLVVGTGDTDLLVTGLFGAVKVVACTIFILWLAERFRRTRLLAVGAIGQAACMLSTAIVYKLMPPVVSPDGTVENIGPAQRATVALIFLDIVFYNWSWGPLPWAISPELFPTRMRALGHAVSMMSHWLWAFVFTISTPPMIKAWTGFGTFLFYAILDCLLAVFVLVFLKETRDKSLEQISKEIQHDLKRDENAEEVERDSEEDSSGEGSGLGERVEQRTTETVKKLS